MTSVNATLQNSTWRKMSPSLPPCRPRRRRSRGSAARSSCRARRRSCWRRRAASRTARPLGGLTCSAPNSAFDDVSEPVMATPSQPMIERQERHDATGAGEPLTERRGHAGQVHHVGQAQHGHHGDDRPLELVERLRRSPASASRKLIRSDSDRDAGRRTARPCRGCPEGNWNVDAEAPRRPASPRRGPATANVRWSSTLRSPETRKNSLTAAIWSRSRRRRR